MTAEQEIPVVETNSEAPAEVKPATKPATKPKAKAKPKAPKASKAPAKPKPAKKAASKAKAKDKPKAKAKTKRPAKDDARVVAKASDGLNTDQIRILRGMRDSPKREVTRDDLQEFCGMGRGRSQASGSEWKGISGVYSSKWLNSLKALARKRPPLISMRSYEGDRKMYHSITAEGRKAINSAEKQAEKVAKEMAA